MDSLDDSYSLTGYEPQRLRLQGDLRRVLHRVPDPTSLSLPSSRSSPSKGFLRTSSTMTPHSRICCVNLTEHMSITPSEKACLSVRKERCDLLESERGRPIESIGQELNVENVQIRTLLDRQTERILAECRAEI